MIITVAIDKTAPWGQLVARFADGGFTVQGLDTMQSAMGEIASRFIQPTDVPEGGDSARVPRDRSLRSAGG